LLSTYELQEYICNEIEARLGKGSCDVLHFEEGKDNSVEGTYIFCKNDRYHLIFAEKGKIRKDIVTDEKREILWYAVTAALFSTIVNYARSNCENGKDFRRPFFAKEKEIFTLFGEDFQKRKDAEIEETLKKYPHNDTI